MDKKLKGQVKQLFDEVVNCKEMPNPKLCFEAELTTGKWIHLHVWPKQAKAFVLQTLNLKQLSELFDGGKFLQSSVSMVPGDPWVRVTGVRDEMLFKVTLHQSEKQDTVEDILHEFYVEMGEINDDFLKGNEDDN